ncbi:MAG: DUF2200 family protein [Cryomorphaceae bacterium]|nr:DUF2200 family protein [Cryomorphaceae bacterium]
MPKSTFQTFFDGADLHANAHLISGTICGYKIQDLDNELTRMVRYLDNLLICQGLRLKKPKRQKVNPRQLTIKNRAKIYSFPMVQVVKNWN